LLLQTLAMESDSVDCSIFIAAQLLITKLVTIVIKKVHVETRMLLRATLKTIRI